MDGAAESAQEGRPLMPRLESCYFEPERGWPGEWPRLAGVLAASAAEHCPDWDRRIVPIGRAPSRGGTGVSSHAANTHKLDVWCARIATAADGEEILLIDADTLILRPLDDVWESAFDLAYTVRDYALPFNLGVLFVRVNERTRQFFRIWQAENLRIYRPGDEAAAWRRQFGGVNQAAFGRLLHAGALSALDLRTLPCQAWNCEVSSWARFDPEVTRIVHINGSLRRQVCYRDPIVYGAIVDAWRRVDRAVKHARRSA